MAERPIIFSGPLVRRILAGEKTQTRRLVKPQPASVERWRHGHPTDCTDALNAVMRDASGKGWASCGPFRCPYGEPGDVLWVRECFMADHVAYSHGPLPKSWPDDLPRADVYYRADGECCEQIPECQCGEYAPRRTPWRPSIHMPRWACRLRLRVTDVRVERVQDITEEDIFAEGLRMRLDGAQCSVELPKGRTHRDTPIGCWEALWDSINGKREGASWDANPWVWVVEFERIEGVH